MGNDFEARIRHVTAVLGPTNTGKTHLAIERMLSHQSGMIGLPLRLLAREVYDKIAARVGADKVALITGEEKIRPERARYWVATVEAMPRDIDVDFLAIDEIQLCADPERGHVFTDRLLNARGREETLLLGAQTMREAISDIIPGANFVSRPRLSKLTYSGEKKITRLPTRSAVVAFSANDVYSIAELIRRQRGGAAVVLGALSPRTRNAQVALYQSGDVDFLVATDAVGMGLNLDVDHVAFAAVRKFDGQNHRNLTPSELGQIAGRAGRHMNDGTFGVTGGVPAFEPDIIERLENHTFDSVKVLQWRNRDLEFSSLEALQESLRATPNEQRLQRARTADDVEALEIVSRDPDVTAKAHGRAAVERLWDVCQVPDYRKISINSHAELIGNLYKFLMGPEGRIPEDWFAKHVAFSDRTDGDIDTLANRIAHIRTWTFVSNRSDWLKDPAHWQGRTREIEDQLSDALHECLTQRFVDRRTSALMRGMRDKEELTAEIREDGAIEVENHFVGRLQGFRFWPDTNAEDVHGKATRHAAAQVLSRELGMRARRVAAAKADAFKVGRTGQVLWRDEEIARLEPTADPLKPNVILLVDEHLSGPDREKVQARLDQWIVELVGDKLKPLVALAKAEDLSGLARGIAFRLVEGFGVLRRDTVSDEIRTLDQPARASLRRYGVRFGAFNIFVPLLLKPAAAELLLTLWSLKSAQDHGLALDALPEPPRAGLTSLATDPQIPEAFYRACGFHVCGPRAVRIDILERLADLIRPLLAWRPETPGDKVPAGATGDGGFTIVPDMMSILGCSGDELGAVLKSLGFWVERKTVKAPVAGEPTSVAAPDNGRAPEQVEGAEAEATSQAVVAGGESDSGERGDAEVAAVASDPAVMDEATAGTVPDAQEASDGAGATISGAEVSGPVETSEVTGAESVSAEAPADDTEVVVEIWRPRRHRAERGGPQRDRRRGRRGGAGGGQHGSRNVPGEGPATAALTPAPTEAAVGGGVGESEGRDQRGRDRDRDRDRRSKEGERQHGRERGREGGRDRNRDRDRDRGDRRPGGRRRDEPRAPQVASAAPRSQKKAGVDPDSPFAALGALKEAMAKQSKEKAP
ncbi:MAG: helicase [Hyphomicrobiaceae bacterium]|nr:helicase [Hyphomicrobiaceae bacterium]